MIRESEKSKIYSQQAKTQENRWQFQSEFEGRKLMAQLKDRKKERKNSFLFSLLFFLGFNGMGEAHSHWGKKYILLSLWIQMLILSRKHLHRHTQK